MDEANKKMLDNAIGLTKKKMNFALNIQDPERSALIATNALCDLLELLGFTEIVDLYEKVARIG